MIPLSPATLSAPAAEGLRAIWFGHSSVLVEIDGVRVMTDPVLSDRVSPVPVGPQRMHAPPISLADLAGIDAVLVSHDHYDHLDMETIQHLAAQGTQFYVGHAVPADGRRARRDVEPGRRGRRGRARRPARRRGRTGAGAGRPANGRAGRGGRHEGGFDLGHAAPPRDGDHPPRAGRVRRRVTAPGRPSARGSGRSRRAPPRSAGAGCTSLRGRSARARRS